MKIKKVDDKPMVIHTKEKAKIHSHEPKGARIKGSNIYTVERGPKIAGAKAAETMWMATGGATGCMWRWTGESRAGASPGGI